MKLEYTQEMLFAPTDEPIHHYKQEELPQSIMDWKKYRVIEQGGEYTVEETSLQTVIGLPKCLGGYGLMHEVVTWVSSDRYTFSDLNTVYYDHEECVNAVNKETESKQSYDELQLKQQIVRNSDKKIVSWYP